jgi:hypothetical protein
MVEGNKNGKVKLKGHNLNSLVKIVDYLLFTSIVQKGLKDVNNFPLIYCDHKIDIIVSSLLYTTKILHLQYFDSF